MLIPGGIFWGHRELPPVTGGVTHTMPPPLTPQSLSINPWQLPGLPTLPYEYRVFRGRASDAFPSEFIMIDEDADFISTVVEVNVRNCESEILFTYDGETIQSLITLRDHETAIKSARGFAIRTKTAGDDADYQIIFYR